MNAINFTRPMNAIDTIAAPIINVPVSPGKSAQDICYSIGMQPMHPAYSWR